ncbi:hypothetical protein MTO96_042150, partial [Rhipicephalus appendiculatus]
MMPMGGGGSSMMEKMLLGSMAISGLGS